MGPLSRVRWWPRGGGADLYRVEHVLATARVILGLGLVASLAFSPVESPAGGLIPGRIGQILLLLVYSLLLLTLIRIRKRVSLMMGVVMHVVDLTWAALVTTTVDGGLGVFSIFSIFALVAAAYRWGLWETLATAGAVAFLVIFQNVITGNLAQSDAGFFDALVSSGAAFWVLNLLMLAWLVGYLGEEEDVLRYEAASTATLMASVQRDHGLGASLRTAAAEMIRIFSAREFLLAAEEIGTGRLFLTSGTRSGPNGDIAYANVELGTDLKSTYLFRAPPAWSTVSRMWRPGPDHFRTLALDSLGRRSHERIVLPRDFTTSHPFRTAVGASFRFDDEWVGRIFLLDVPIGATRPRALQFLQRLVREVGPALHELYLIRRLRHQVGAAERARVARELHDGVIQSLVAVEMRLDVLKRQAMAAPERVEPELGQLKTVIHEEVLALRDLLRHMKPPDPGPNLANYLADVIDRFRRDTGIGVVFASDRGDTPLGPSTRREIVRIVQEALVNIRKHSGARNVVVRMEVDSAACRLTVDDDGHGYDFAGRRTMEELDAARRGPVVIEERVRDMRGTVAIESVPGRGSRLEIVVPRRI